MTQIHWIQPKTWVRPDDWNDPERWIRLCKNRLREAEAEERPEYVISNWRRHLLLAEADGEEKEGNHERAKELRDEAREVLAHQETHIREGR